MTTTQQDAARVLVKLTTLGLPRLTWVLPCDGDGWRAQPPATVSDDVKALAMEAWAAHLGAAIEVKRYGGYTEMWIRAEVDGVRVEIFSHTTSDTYEPVGSPR